MASPVRAWASCCSNRCGMDPMILDRDLDPFDNTRDYEMNKRSGGSGGTPPRPLEWGPRGQRAPDPFDLDPI